MPRAILIVGAIAALIYAALCLALFWGQRSFIYFPTPKSIPDDKPPLALNVDGERILISVGTNTGSNAVIYFGGNAEDVRRSLPTLAEAFPERSVYAMNYRGYGGSTGKPSETALVADALVLFDYVHADHSKIVVIGRSLGSGVATHLASERPVERLILVTPYDSIVRIATKQFAFFPVHCLMIDKFESWRYASRVTAPTQLIAAQNDEVIPAASTAELYQHFPRSLATLIVIPGVGHNTISESPQYIPLLTGTL